MQNNHEIPYWWASVIGLHFPILQAAVYYARFGTYNPYAPLFDYVLFFLGGTLGAFILIALLRRSPTRAAKWSVSLAFLLGTPLAFIGSLGGGLLGALGVILLPALIWGVFTAIGYWIGSLIAKAQSKRSEG